MPPEKPMVPRVQVIAHRGASALRPEHTLAAYMQAILDGADWVEPDLVMTRDGVLVARHENAIGGTTDVVTHPAFAARRTRKSIDGVMVDDWFVEDFTLAELKTLRARERLPALRGTRFDGQFAIPTFTEIVELVARESAVRGRRIGLIPEIKHGTYFQGIGLPMEDVLLDALAAHAYTHTSPVEIQSFEIGNLRYLRERLGAQHANVRLLQLIDAADMQPFDVVAAGGAQRYADMVTPAGLRDIAGYADAIGPSTRAVIPLDPGGRLMPPTTLVRDAHAAGLEVHVWTFRPEQQFMARDFWCDDDPATRNAAGSIAEIRAYLDAGIDAFFSDDPGLGRMAVDGG
ncbi:glycerophosphodiester phosphodiesterase [Rhodanobacter glycinis]|uniref:glycerophosphodiester phosphodiesterase n=1 Tax=Rhodanobacter glycinis TaxID=582702 RepID=A0A5B9E7U8_9GAMM|nr:glycerophosphodiester phosphodiesterase [Rhodanobacter glycinis]